MLNVGDQVELTQDTKMDRAGDRGVVTFKYVPAHCTGVWAVHVQLAGNAHLTAYPYPTGGLLRKIDAEA